MAGIWNVAGPEVNGYVLLAIDRKSLKWNKRYTRMKQHFRLIIEWPNTNWIWALIFCQAAKFYLCLIFVNLDTQILKECSLHNSLRDVERRKTKRLLPVQFWLFQRSLHEHCVPVGWLMTRCSGVFVWNKISVKYHVVLTMLFEKPFLYFQMFRK